MLSSLSISVSLFCFQGMKKTFTGKSSFSRSHLYSEVSGYYILKKDCMVFIMGFCGIWGNVRLWVMQTGNLGSERWAGCYWSAGKSLSVSALEGWLGDGVWGGRETGATPWAMGKVPATMPSIAAPVPIKPPAVTPTRLEANLINRKDSVMHIKRSMDNYWIKIVKIIHFLTLKS